MPGRWKEGGGPPGARDAENYDPGDNDDLFINLGRIYDQSNDVAKSIRMYEKGKAVLEREGAFCPDHDVDYFNTRIALLKSKLAPRPIEAERPALLSPEELEKILAERLTPEEQKLVENPLAAGPELTAWAVRQFGGVKNETERAQRIFQVVIEKFDFGLDTLRPAGNAYGAMDQPDARLSGFE